jgi:hypothetical protein
MIVDKPKNDCLDFVVLVLVRQGVYIDPKVSSAHRIPFDSGVAELYQRGLD